LAKDTYPAPNRFSKRSHSHEPVRAVEITPPRPLASEITKSRTRHA